MSRENVEVVRRGFDLFNRGDIDAFCELFSEDVEIHPLQENPDAEVSLGREGVRQIIRNWTDVFDEVSAAPEEFIDAGGHVVIPLSLSARGLTSGISAEFRHTYVITLREGKVIQWWIFATTEEALEAVGLRE